MEWVNSSWRSTHWVRHVLRIELLNHADGTITARTLCGYTIIGERTTDEKRPICGRCEMILAQKAEKRRLEAMSV